MRRRTIYFVGLVFCLSILLFIMTLKRIADNTSYEISTENQRNLKAKENIKDGEETYSEPIPIVLYDGIQSSAEERDIPVISKSTYSPYDINRLEDSENILEKARSEVENQFSKYNFTLSGVRGLDELSMETGGQPIRSLIISSWRSGSTFLGDLVNSVPGTYYHYEPLLLFNTKQIRRAADAVKPLNMVKRMLQCDFDGLEDYFDYERVNKIQFTYKTRLWDYCKFKNETDLCYNPEFVSRLCKVFPIQTMKLVRLRLHILQEILDFIIQHNVKVILLVRDPRGVMQSRRHRQFCKLSPDCWEPSIVCSDMVSDYEAAAQILQQYPDRLMVIRFEELALNPNSTAKRIQEFLKLDAAQAFNDFLQTHTQVEVGGPYSTIRDSRNVPFKWKTALDFSFVNQLQKSCKEAMGLWGYKMAHNELHMKSEDFNPLDEYVIV